MRFKLQLTTQILFIILAGVILTTCSSRIKSSSSKTKGIDLKKYKTFAWAMPTDAEAEKRKDDKHFSGLILELSNTALQKKGFVLNSEKPDAIFAFDTRVEDRIAYTQTPYINTGYGFGGYGYYGGPGYYSTAPMAGGQVLSSNYEEGMLVIEMYDTKTQKLLWRGWAKEKITAKTDIEADIRKAVKQIFTRLPVKHK